nr:hypothetical protein [Tanacetum cinerariifolium]
MKWNENLFCDECTNEDGENIGTQRHEEKCSRETVSIYVQKATCLSMCERACDLLGKQQYQKHNAKNVEEHMLEQKELDRSPQLGDCDVQQSRFAHLYEDKIAGLRLLIGSDLGGIVVTTEK